METVRHLQQCIYISFREWLVQMVTGRMFVWDHIHPGPPQSCPVVDRPTPSLVADRFTLSSFTVDAAAGEPAMPREKSLQVAKESVNGNVEAGDAAKPASKPASRRGSSSSGGAAVAAEPNAANAAANAAGAKQAAAPSGAAAAAGADGPVVKAPAKQTARPKASAVSAAVEQSAPTAEPADTGAKKKKGGLLRFAR